MRENDAPQPVLILDDVVEIRQHQVDAIHIVLGEHYSAVDNHHVAAILIDCHILANFPQAAEGNYP
jgi:hypothetical protein